MKNDENLGFQRRCTRWLLLLTLIHTVPAVWVTPVVAGAAPTAALLAYGLASLFTFSREGIGLGLMVLAPGLIYSAVAWAVAWLSGWWLARLSTRARHVGAGMLAVVTIALLSAVYFPIYGFGGHGPFRTTDLFSLFDGAIGPHLLVGYWVGLHVVLAVLFAGAVVRADHPAIPVARRWVKPVLVGAAVAVSGVLLFYHYDRIACRPFAELGVARAQRCVAQNAGPEQRYWYERAAAGGDAEALAWLIANTPNRTTRLEWARQGAERGDPASQYALSQLLLRTPGEDAKREAEQWLLRSADAGHADAQFAIAERLSKDLYRTKSPEGVAERAGWLDRAAANGSLAAKRRLAQHLTDGGMGYPVDFDRARSLYRELISDEDSADDHRQRLADLDTWERGLEDGDPAVMRAMAKRYLSSSLPGPGVREKGRELMEQLASAGDTDARDELIVSLRTGSGGMAEDVAAARHWLVEAANAGDTAAMQRIARNFMNGREGFPIDYPRSRHWIEKQIAVYTGGDDRDAQARLRSLKKDLAYIERLGGYAGGEMLGNADLERLGQRSDAQSRYEHAIQLLVGHGSGRRAEAIGQLREAAEGGHGGAAWRLFQIYERGFADEIDADAAWRALQLAAANHHFDATRELAVSYEYGKRVEVDLPRAIEIYERALEAGHDNRYGWNLDPGNYNHYKWLESRLRQARMKLDRAHGPVAGL